jgi:hypothetical protein
MPVAEGSIFFTNLTGFGKRMVYISFPHEILTINSWLENGHQEADPKNFEASGLHVNAGCRKDSRTVVH